MRIHTKPSAMAMKSTASGNSPPIIERASSRERRALFVGRKTRRPCAPELFLKRSPCQGGTAIGSGTEVGEERRIVEDHRLRAVEDLLPRLLVEDLEPRGEA